MPNQANLEKVKSLYPYEWAKPIYFPQRKRNLLLMENAAWDYLKDKIDMTADFVGTLSSRAHEKMCMKKFDRVLRNKSLAEYEYVNFKASMNIAREEGEWEHPGFKKVWDELCTRLGDCNINLRSCFCNYWMCRPKLFLNLSAWMDRVLSTIDTMPLAKEPTVYYSNHLLSPEQLVELWGKPYYPLHIFLLERFNLQYFRNYKCLLIPEVNLRFSVSLHWEVRALCLGILILLLYIKYPLFK